MVKSTHESRSLPPFDGSLFGGCTRSDLVKLLKEAQDRDNERMLLVAATLLASIEANPQFPPANDVIRVPFEFLSGATSPLAHRLIQQFAEHSPIACIRIEAVKRLGAVADEPATKEMIRTWAEKGFPLGMTYQHEQRTADAPRIAAITALGAVPKPDDADLKIVMAVLDETLSVQPNPCPVFDEAAASLNRISRPADVPKIVELIGKCPHHDRRLRLLAVCAKHDKQLLVPHQSKLTKALCESIQQWNDSDAQLTMALKELGTKFADTNLLKMLAEWYSGDMLTHGRGDLIATVMQAHGGTKEDLQWAALVFARSPANAQRGELCAKQLKVCASAGFYETVRKRLLDEDAQGYQVILENGTALDILGPVARLVEGYCEHVGSTPEPNRRTALAHKCAVSLLAIQLSGSKDCHFAACQLFDIRLQHRNTYQVFRDSPVTEAALICRSASAETDALGALAQRVAGALPDLGAIEIIKQFVWHDKVGELVVERVFASALETALTTPGGIAEESAVRQFEKVILPDWQQNLAALLSPVTVLDGTLNRAVLDLVRRNNFSFVDVSKKVLGANLSLSDVDFVLESLACSEDGKAIELLAQSCGHHESDRNRTNHIRTKAIELLENHLKKSSGADNGTVPLALAAIHDRLCDTPSVRMAAYRACGSIGDLGSIRPLRDRQGSETDAKAKHELAVALDALKARLVASRPSISEAKTILRWINHVGELGDGSFLGNLKVYLFPAHPNHEVLLAALDAIGKIENVVGVQVVQEYINDTAPPPPILAKARRVRMALEQRNDIDLFQNLARFLPEDSPALDPAINYESLLGLGPMRSATKVLRDCGNRIDVGHWDDFVTRINAIFELMVRVVYTRCNAAMGIDDAKRNKMLKGGEYGPLISFGEFKQAFPSLQAICQQLLVLRRDAAVAHAGNPDGSEKAGVDEDDAQLAKGLFAKAWPQFVETLKQHGVG